MNKSLNTFRTFAFFAVFFVHSYSKILPFGYLGVSAFFVLSGYLITPILIKTKERSFSFKDYLINFYGRRALRIFPIYYLLLLFLTIVAFTGSFRQEQEFRLFVHQLPYALTYTYNFYHTLKSFSHSSLISHFWSLAVEEQFYIIFPIVLYYTSYRKLKKVLLIGIIISPIIRLLTGIIIDHNLISFLSSNKGLVVYVLPFSHIDSLLIGAYAGVYLKQYKPSGIIILSILIFIFLLGCLASYVTTNHLQVESFGYRAFMNDSFKYVWGYVIWAIFFNAILMRLNHRDFLYSFSRIDF